MFSSMFREMQKFLKLIKFKNMKVIIPIWYNCQINVFIDWCLTEQHQYFTKNSKQLLHIYLNIDENMLRKFLCFSNTWRYFGFSPSQISTNIFTCGCFGLKINQLPANQEPQFRAEITFFYIFYLNQIQWLPVICVLINFDG